MPATSSPNIVVVDDTPGNLTVLNRILSEQGFPVRPAINRLLALKAIRKAPPDIILLDIMMPGMDGYEIGRHLKADQATRAIPITFISTIDELDGKIQAFQLGGVAGATNRLLVSNDFESSLAESFCEDSQKAGNVKCNVQIAGDDDKRSAWESVLTPRIV